MKRPLSIALTLLAATAAHADGPTVRQTSGTYIVQLPAGPAARMVDDVRLLPVTEGERVSGMRLSNVGEGSLVGRAGLREGDVIRGIDNRPVDGVESALEGLQAGVDRGRLFLHVERDGQRLALTYIVEKLADPGAEPAATPEARPTSAPTLDWVTADGEGRFTVTRAGLDAALADPATLSRGARIIPAREDAALVGFKLAGVRPSSVFAALGLRNGDILREANGLPLTSPDKALQAYSALRKAPTITLAITRGGQPTTLTYTVKDGDGAPAHP